MSSNLRATGRARAAAEVRHTMKRSERLAGDPLAQQRIDDDVAVRFAGDDVVAQQRAEAACTVEGPPRRWRVRASADISSRPSWSTTARSTPRCGNVKRCQSASKIVCCSASSRRRVRWRSSSVTRRLPDARSSSQVSWARRWTSYGRLPASSTIAAPNRGSGAMPERLNRASMDAANSSAGILSSRMTGPAL